MPKTFGSYLRQIREHREMTLKEVADKAGIHLSTLSRIERDELDPSLESQLVPISKALGMGVVSLLRNYTKH